MGFGNTEGMGPAFHRVGALVVAAFGLLFLGASLASGATGETVLFAEVDGPITPVVADYLAAAVTEAEDRGALLVVRIDTPGGLDTSMRHIVQSFLNAQAPVVAFVGPEGARAASAGTFIVLSAHVAAMAPATSIGAATPVDLQGGEITDKIVNDSVAFAVSLAERRNRDVAFAEDAVRDGVSVTATVAEDTGVVDIRVADLDDLIAQIDGLVVEVAGEDVTLVTRDATVERFELSTFRRILGHLADPNLAFIFMSFGTLAIVYEAANPGMGFAGIAGVIALLLGFFSLSVLPVTAVGVALLILAAALFIGEVFVPGVGVMAAGGTIALLLAGLFLFEGTLSVSAPVLWPVALVLGGATIVAGRLAFRARMARPTTGASTLVGQTVTVGRRDGERGDVFVDGSWWTARSEEGTLEPGTAEVVAVDGLTLVVRHNGGQDEH
ncbi:nodulation protein NfeD [soil metagenome]